MNILALDLGKFNTLCCFFDTAIRKYRFKPCLPHHQEMILNIRIRNHRVSDDQNDQTRRPNDQTRRPKECATPKEDSLLSCSSKPPGR